MPRRAPALTHAAQQVPATRPSPEALARVHQALRVLEAIARYSRGVGSVRIARETKRPQLVIAERLAMRVEGNLATPIGSYAYAYASGTTLAPAVGAGTAGANGMSQLQPTLALVRDAVGAAVYVGRYTEGEVP
ncbi:hypothetical protein [Streptomyces sp. NPDC096339]|uniref:hypothetical protein n=1 Tax=Streptomyces sp. NPDC096339 TaxID=3366086 RepID=UPI00382F01F5